MIGQATLPKRAQSGFTLLEVLVAFTMMALLVGTLMQLVSGAIRGTRQSDEYTQAALWAQSKLAGIGIETPVEEGTSEGQFDDLYSWELTVTPYEGESDGQNLIVFDDLPPVELFHIELIVQWRRAGVRNRQASFTSLRSTIPDTRR